MGICETKVVGAGAAAAALALSMAACGDGGSHSGSSSPSGGAKEITVTSGWASGSPEGDVQTQIAKKFEEETGIHLAIEEGGQEARDIYETQYAAGDEPDMAWVNLYDKTLGWTEAGVAVPVTEYAEEWGLKDRIKPDALTDWTDKDGQLRAFPYSGFTWPVLWNTNLLREAGMDDAPVTTDKLLDLVPALSGKTAFGAPGADWGGEKLFSQIIQDRITDDEIRTLFSEGGWKDSAPAREGVEYFIELRDAGTFGKAAQGQTVDMMYADYNEQDSAGMSAGNWAFEGVPDDVREVTYVGGFPISDKSVHSKPTAYQGFTSTGFWISPKGVDKIDLIKQFVEFMYRDDIVAMFVKDANMVPAITVSGALENDNSIMYEALNDLDDRVDYVVIQDIYVPASAGAGFTSATSLAWGNADADTILAALDQAYGK